MFQSNGYTWLWVNSLVDPNVKLLEVERGGTRQPLFVARYDARKRELWVWDCIHGVALQDRFLVVHKETFDHDLSQAELDEMIPWVLDHARPRSGEELAE